MNILFIEQAKKCGLIKKLFREVELRNKKIIINKNVSKINLKKKMKIVGKMQNKLDKNNCKKVVLSKSLKSNTEFLNLIYTKNIEVVDGRRLFKMFILEIVELIEKEFNMEKRESQIAILSNDYNRFVAKVIKELAPQCKFLNIVTHNIQKFENLEESLKEDGIIINITNNRKKSLLKSQIILNLDFPEEVINRYSILDKAIIVNFEEAIKIKKKRFSGMVINWYKLILKNDSKLWDLINKQNLSEYDFNEILEYYYYMGQLGFDEVRIAI